MDMKSQAIANSVAPDKRDVWIVGLEQNAIVNWFTWDFIGVFDDYEKAKEQCRTERHFIYRATLNQRMDFLPRSLTSGIEKGVNNDQG